MEIIVTTLLIAAGVYALSFITWIFYLAVMNLIAHRDRLGRVAKAHAYLVIGIGLVIDALLNLVFSLLVFWDRPRAKLLTGTLQYHLYRGTSPRRKAVVLWLCANLLDPFDPTGRHC